MTSHLMSGEDLARVTGWKRYSRQARWFKEQFGVDVARSADGSPVVTWATFQALQDKQAGLTLPAAKYDDPPPVYLLRKA